MPRTLSSENNKTKKRKYREIPYEIRELIIEQVLMEGAITQSEAARRYGQSTSTVRNILDTFCTEGRIGPKSRGGRKKGSIKLKDAHEEYIREILDKDCTKTLEEIKQELMCKFPDLGDKGISTSGLWNFMSQRKCFPSKQKKGMKKRRSIPETVQ